MDPPIESGNSEIDMEATTSGSPSADQQHTFVVENVEGRIRDSLKSNSLRSDGSKNSLQNITSSFAPDPEVIRSLENYANEISRNLDVVLRDLGGSLKGKFLIEFDGYHAISHV